MISLATLATDQRMTFLSYLRARPFTAREQAHWALCWLEITQPQLDSINDALPHNTRCTAKQLDGKLYINSDIISDAIDSGRLAAILSIVQGLTWRYVDPWQWEQSEAEAWVPYDGTPSTIFQISDIKEHNSKQWVSTVPNNVWEPGVFGWKEKTVGGMAPTWRQPLGAGDTWEKDDEVLWGNKHWRSNINANTTEPGSQGSEQFWTDITVTAPPAETPDWAPGQVVAVGDLRMYLGIKYRCRQAHTTQAGWTPPAVPALWEIAT